MRRAGYLTLAGIAVVGLALSGCVGEPADAEPQPSTAPTETAAVEQGEIFPVTEKLDRFADEGENILVSLVDRSGSADLARILPTRPSLRFTLACEGAGQITYGIRELAAVTSECSGVHGNLSSHLAEVSHLSGEPAVVFVTADEGQRWAITVSESAEKVSENG